MKGNFSRQTFDRRKHYRGVLMQQGRVQLDADWNEQQDILLHRLETTAYDMMGQSGVPDREAGFDIGFTPDNRDLWISPGRIYVDGMLCELEEPSGIFVKLVEPSTYRIQIMGETDWLLDGREFEVGQWLEMRNQNGDVNNFFQIIEIDADNKILTLYAPDEDSKLNKQRKGTILEAWRTTTYTTQPHYPQPEFTTVSERQLRELKLPEDKHIFLVYLDVWQRYVTALDDSSIREVALGGPDTTARMQTVWQVKLLPITAPEDLQKLIDDHTTKLQEKNPTAQSLDQARRLEQQIMQRLNSFTCDTAVNEWNKLTEPPTGTLNAGTYFPDRGEDSGYQGLENQLYRVEIHEGHDIDGITKPTFKWAYDNASLLALVNVEGTSVTVPASGEGSIGAFNKGQWVELINDMTELNPQLAPKGLARITHVDPINNQLTLDSSLMDGENLKLRAWDGIEEIDPKGKWMPLDGGIQLQFSNGEYRTGDYWLITARTSTREIEWPPYQIPNANPLPQLRHGPEHHYCRLARFRHYVTPNYPSFRIRDCRRFFAPTVHSANTLHITGINWQNDGHYSRALLKKEGLQIAFDTPPDSHGADPYDPGRKAIINSATMIVTLETALPGGGGGVFVMGGIIDLQGNKLIWRWRDEEKEGIVARALQKLDEIGHDVLNTTEHYVRVRVTLKGYAIWRDLGRRRIYLDGQIFGIGGAPGRIELQFPSGAGARASDFESWFYMRE